MGKLIQFCTEESKMDRDFSEVWTAAGMGYIIQTESKHFIVIDGGRFRGDAEGILSIMEELTDGKPVVELWILTHPHVDHYLALAEIVNTPELFSRVEVKAFCYSIPTKEDIAWGAKDLDAIADIIDKLDCETVVPHADDVITVDGYKIKFFFTWKNHPNLEKCKTFNALSLILQITGKDKTAMFLGDSTAVGTKTVYQTYADRLDELKSDIVQVAHHGLDGGDTKFYRAVDASTVLVPTSLGGAKFQRQPETICNAANVYAQNRGLTVIQACTGTAWIEL